MNDILNDIKINQVDIKLNQLNTIIIKLETDLNIINKKLDLLINVINKDVKEDCKKMSYHIDFIERVYENIKAPMNYICIKFNNMKILEF